MGDFSSEWGNIHFLFANEDDYYTESLVKLGRRQYINYCLRREGYAGIFFIEKSSSGYVVEMGNSSAAEIYPYEEPDVHLFWGRKNVKREWEEIRKGGKRLGLRCYARHDLSEEVCKRIHTLMKKRDRYAFVMSMELFAVFYKDSEIWQELHDSLKKGGGSILILTSAANADDSFSLLTSHGDIFPVVRKIINRGRHVRFYEELSNEMGKRYHVFNQMRKEEIRRLLQYMQIVEGAWEEKREGQLDDYTDFLYAQYHFVGFGEAWGTDLPEKGKRSLRELATSLEKKQSRIWQQMDRCIEAIRKNSADSRGLELIIQSRFEEEKEWHPRFIENADVRRIRRAVQGVAVGTGREIAAKLQQVEGSLTMAWNDYENRERKELHRMAQMLERLQERGIRSDEIVIRVLDYLYYSISSRERYEAQSLFCQKSQYSEKLIECLCTRKELENALIQPRERLEKYHAQQTEVKEKFKKLTAEPVTREILRRIKEGELEISYLAIHAPEVYQLRMELVQVNDLIKTTGQIISIQQQKINDLAQNAANLENMLTEINRQGEMLC